MVWCSLAAEVQGCCRAEEKRNGRFERRCTVKRVSRLILIIIFITGCVGSVFVPVKVETNPAGVIVEYNGNKVGRSPCDFNIKIPVKQTGCLYANYGTFGYVSERKLNYFRAFPIDSGQYTQTKILSDYDIAQQEHLIIYFDMNLKPAPEEYRIEWRNK
jgi:hypothetical protein